MAEHPGHRDNPIEVTRPGDLDRACARAWDPTPAQAEAGNYKMAHAIVGGLDVAIETPKDRVRSGIGPDGSSWSVRMPNHYGYAKKTIGADQDAIDVYIGDEAHRVTELPVWVIDQCDAETGEYDEAKVMLGFADVADAKRSYLAAFSDGKGARRVGGVTRMAFDEFRGWLDSGRTKRPLLMKSASAHVIAASYGAAPCRCDQCTGKGNMTTETAKSAISAGDAGLMTRLIAKGVQSLTPEERVTMLADASVQASSWLTKAREITMVGDDHDKIGHIEDLWDGPPDDHAETVRAHGPDSSAPSGKVNTGPGQSASGNGAEKMEGEYSRHAMQTGVQRATEKLGEAIMGMGKSMKALRLGQAATIGAIEAQGLQIEALKAGAGAGSGLTEASVKAMIDASLAKSIGGIDIAKVVAKAVRQALAKAEEDKDDEDDKGEVDKAVTVKAEESDKDDDADDDEESGEGTKIEIDNDIEDDDDDEDATGKAIAAKATRLRQLAKNRLGWVDRRIAKAVKAEESNKPKTAAHQASMAHYNMAKAVAYAEAAKALTGKGGDGTKWLGKAIAKAKGKMPSGAKNQDIWPASNDSKVGTGKSASSDADKGAVTLSTKAFEEAAEKLSKAAAGIGMMVTDMSGLMSVFAGQSKGDGLPPAFALAKANTDTLAAKRGEISKLFDDNIIDFEARTKGIEVLNMTAARSAPPEYISGLIARLPEKVQHILAPAA